MKKHKNKNKNKTKNKCKHCICEHCKFRDFYEWEQTKRKVNEEREKNGGYFDGSKGVKVFLTDSYSDDSNEYLL